MRSIALILRKLLGTYNMTVSARENFLQLVEVSRPLEKYWKRHLKWTSMRCRNKQKPIYFKEFLIFFLHSKCDMKLRLSILRSDIFIFCKNSSRRTHCVQMRMSPNNFDIFEVNKLRFQDEKCDFLKKSETLVKR